MFCLNDFKILKFIIFRGTLNTYIYFFIEAGLAYIYNCYQSQFNFSFYFFIILTTKQFFIITISQNPYPRSVAFFLIFIFCIDNFY